MPKRIQLPDGSIGEFPDEMSDDDITAVLVKQFPPQQEGALSGMAQAFRSPGAEGPVGTLEALAGGAKHGLDRFALGAKGLFSEKTPEDEALLAQGRAFSKEAGLPATIGQIGGEIGATWPIGGPVAAGGKLLTKAVPALESLAKMGGRLFNLGTAGRGAAEAGIAGGLVEPEDGSSRLGNAASSATLGAALPLALASGGAAKDVGKRMIGAVMPGKNAAEARAAKEFGRALGDDNYAGLIDQVKNASPTRLPQTTAALADSRELGALERGARGRGTAPFAEHDAQVLEKVWNSILDDTSEGARAGLLAQRPARVESTLQNMLATTAVPPSTRKIVSQDLGRLISNSDAMLDPQTARVVARAQAIVESGSSTAATLRQLQLQLRQRGQKSPMAAQAADIIGEELDFISNGLLAKAEASLATRGQQATEAGAERAIRDTFMPEGAMPTTSTMLPGSNGPVPVVRGQQLRKAIAKQRNQLAPTTRDDLMNTAEELRRHEIYKPISSGGGSEMVLGNEQQALQSAMAAGRMWGPRAMLQGMFGYANRATQEVIDEALLDPQRFLQIAAKKQAQNVPLTQGETAALWTIMQMNREAAVPGEQ